MDYTMYRLFFILLLYIAILSCTSAQNTKEMKSISPAEIVSIADTFKLADDVLIPYRVGDKFGFCDKDRNIVIEPKYTMATPFSNGYAGVVIKPEDALHTVAGYINKKGEMVTGFDYTFIEPFLKDERAIVRNLGAQYGIINTAGEYVVPAVFDLIEYRPDLGLYLVRADGKYGLVDKDNNVKLPIEHNHFYHEAGSNMIIVQKGEKWGCYNKKMELVIPFEYDELYVSKETDELFYARIGEKKYLMNSEEVEVLDVSQYHILSYFNERIAVTEVQTGFFEAKWGLIEIPSGKEILPCEFSVIRGSSYGVLTLQIEVRGNEPDRCGLINEKGEFLVEPKYNYMMILDEDFIHAYKENDTKGLVFDSKGNVMFESFHTPHLLGNTKTSRLYKYTNLNAEPDLYGIIDKKGNVIIPPIYERLDDFGFDDNGLILAQKNGKLFYMDIMGREYIK